MADSHSAKLEYFLTNEPGQVQDTDQHLLTQRVGAAIPSAFGYLCVSGRIIQQLQPLHVSACGPQF
jgi:hypothetical protein